MLLVGDGALDQDDVDAFGVCLDVDERRVDDVGLLREVDEEFVEVEERHVAARAAAEPDGRELQTFHCFFSRAVTRKREHAAVALRFGDGRALAKMAPVGQAWTHLPHDVQVGDVPQGWFRSVMTRDLVPRPATSQVWAPSISSQARTQRVQRTQRL